MLTSSIKPGTHRNEFRAYYCGVSTVDRARSLFELFGRKTIWKDFCWPGVSLQGEESLWSEEMEQVQPGTTEESPVFEVFPNPTKTTLFVRLPDSAPGAKLLLFDMNGRIVTQVEVRDQGNSLEIDVKDLPSGLYWLAYLSAYGEREIRRVAVTR
jgi:hypothetical protein